MNGGSPLVRPWLKAGLNVLLVDDEARALELRGGDGESGASRQEMDGGAAQRGPANGPVNGPAQPANAHGPASAGPVRVERGAAPARPADFGIPPRPEMPAPRPGKPAPNFDDARFARPVVSGATRTVPPAARPDARPDAPRPLAPQNPAPNPANAPRTANPATPQNPAPNPVPAPAPRPAPRPGTSLLAAPGALPVESWPASWLALRDRRPLPPRPLVLWSYAGLGDDLVGTPDEARRRVIVRMLTELRHPVGTHVFWPFALPQEDSAGAESSAQASLFWSGVSMLDPRVLLLFGSDTRDALDMPKSLLPFCQARVHGRLVIQLPRPQALASDESAFRQAQAFLSRILRFCAR